MKSFFRKLFSPTALIALILLLEILLAISLYYFFDAIMELAGVSEAWASIAYAGFKLIVGIIEFILFYVIINRYENPEYKIPWLVCMVILPVTTMLVYVIFGNHGVRPIDKKILDPSNAIIEKKFKPTKDLSEDFKSEVPLEYRGIFRYLRHATKLRSSGGNRITYYKSGEFFFPEFVESLKKAEKFIFMEFFIIGEGVWWKKIEDVLVEKAAQGVDVRVLYDDMGSFGVLPSAYPRIMKHKGLKVYKFHPFRPILSGVYNNRDHRKICIIDHQMAFTGGMNLADEYANEIARFGYWKDTMVKIEGPAINNLLAIFLQNHDLCTHQLSDYEGYLSYDYPTYDEPGYAFPFGDGPGSYDGGEDVGEKNYINIINSAKKELYISTPYLIVPYKINEALIDAAQRGVEVHLIVPGIPDKKPVYWMAQGDFNILTRKGIHIYTYTPGFNHEKQMLADDRVAFVGTINFDFRSLTHHFECGITFIDAPCLKELKDDFLEMISQSKEVEKNFRINPIKKFFTVILKIFRTLL
ncbi:MAG: cardiolipin synthase [Bacilli bacterium]|nr:cardiolipin synthase [Bacilli bacterium]